MAGEIDIVVTKQAQAEVDKLLVSLKSTYEEIVKVNQNAINFNGRTAPRNPTDVLEATKKLNELYLAQQKTIKDLEDKIKRLSIARQNSVTRTSEEIVNQRALAQESDRQARATSALVGAYANLNARHQQARRTLQDLIASQTASNQQIRIAQDNYDNLDRQITQADRAVRVFNRNVGNYPSQAIAGIKDLLGAFGILGGISLAAGIAKDIFNTTKELQSLDLALKQVTGSNETFSKSQQFLKQVSEDYGVEIKGLTKQYTQFYVSAKDKISGNQINDIFKSISKSAGFMGLSVDAQNMAFTALNQMMSKGTVSAEELKGQLGEALPGAFGIMAKAMGVTEVELGKLMKDGKVMASDVLPKFAKQLEITYGIENKDRVESLSASVTRLSNHWTDFIASMNSGSGMFSKALMLLIDGISTVTIGFNYAIQSAKEYRRELNGTIENKGYVGTLDYLNKIKDKQEQIKDATTLREEGNKRISELAEQNKWLNDQYQILSKTEKLERGVVAKILGLPKTASADLKDLNDKIKENTNSIYLNKGQIDAANEILKVNTDLQNENNGSLDTKIRNLKTLADLEIKQADFYASDYALRKKILENSRDNNKAVFDDETKTFAQRNDAYDKMMQAKSILVSEAYAEEKRIIAKEESDNKNDIISTYNDRIREIKELEADKNVIYTDGANDRNQALAEKEKALDALVKDSFNKRALATKTFTQNQIGLATEYSQALAEVLKTKLSFAENENIISQETLNALEKYQIYIKSFTDSNSLGDFKKASETKKNIVEDETLKILQLKIDANAKEMEGMDSTTEAYTKLNKVKIALETEYVKIKTKNHEDELKRLETLKKNQLNYLDKFKQSWGSVGLKSLDFFTVLEENGQTAFQNLIDGAINTKEEIGTALVSVSEVFQEIMNKANEASEERYQNEIKRLESQKNIAIAYAGESETAKAEVERQYEAKRKKLEHDRAVQKKKQAITNITIDTAQAVIATFAKLGWPAGIAGAAFVAAAGLAQIAMVSSQQIPEYFKGTDNHSGGLMLINDGKGSDYKEVVETPDGKLMQYEGRNVLTSAPKGTKVHTAKQWNEKLNSILMENSIMPMSNTSTAVYNGLSKAEFNEGIGRLQNTIENKESFSIERDVRGEKIYKIKQGAKTELLNNRLKIKSFNV